MHPSTRFRFRCLRLFALFSALSLGLGLSACQPYPLEFYVRATTPCSASTASGEQFGGFLDLSIRSTYSLGFTLVNALSATGNPLTLSQETNTLTVKSAEIFLEFPDNFSLKGSDPALFPKEKPFTFPLQVLIEPTLAGGNIQGVGAVAVTGGIAATLPSKKLIDFPVFPFETGALLAKQNVVEIGRDRFLQVVVNVVFKAHNFIGTNFSSPSQRYTILLCKGCLDQRQDLAAECENLNACTGQDDNICKNKAAAP